MNLMQIFSRVFFFLYFLTLGLLYCQYLPSKFKIFKCIDTKKKEEAMTAAQN